MAPPFDEEMGKDMIVTNAVTKSLTWAVATRPLPGEMQSGDGYAVVPTSAGVLVAVIDGLGHGDAAAEATRRAVDVINVNAELPLADIFRRCNDRLVGSRGAVMSLAHVDESASSVTWAGIGNVEGTVVRANHATTPTRERLLIRGGVVGSGFQLGVRSQTLPLAVSDLLVLTTDGIHWDFTISSHFDAPEYIAGHILRNHARESDDALVFIGRWNGSAV